MKTAAFTHLHVHSQYSLLDGAIRLPDLFSTVRTHGMDTVALTDHGNMYGVVDFYKRAKQEGVRPIFGCETYITGDRLDRTERKNYHLILLAKDQVGYQNLTYLNSKGFLEGFYHNPRIDKALLKERSQGLIGLSACLGGEVAQALSRGGYAAAKEAALEYQSLFEKGDFYLEVMDNGLPEQAVLNGELRRIAGETGIPLVATGDCHYVRREDARAHEVLMAIQQGRTLTDDKRLKHDVDAYYIKSPAEFERAFHDVPQALESTVEIAGRCHVELDLGKTYLPRYKVPPEFATAEGVEDLDRYCGHIARE